MEKVNSMSGTGSMIMLTTMIWEILIRVHNMLVQFLEGLRNTPTLVGEELVDHPQKQVRLSYLLFWYSFKSVFTRKKKKGF